MGILAPTPGFRYSAPLLKLLKAASIEDAGGSTQPAARLLWCVGSPDGRNALKGTGSSLEQDASTHCAALGNLSVHTN